MDKTSQILMVPPAFLGLVALSIYSITQPVWLVVHAAVCFICTLDMWIEKTTPNLVKVIGALTGLWLASYACVVAVVNLPL